MRLLKFLPVILVCLLLGGCWDSQELEDRLSVTGIAIDQDKDQLVVSILTPIPQNNMGISGGATATQQPVQIFTGRGKTLSDATNDIRFQSNKRVTFGDTRLIIISEKVAKQGLSNLLDAFGRNPEFRRREYMIVAKGEAQHFFQLRSPLESNPAGYIISFLKNKSEDELIMKKKGLNHFFIDEANPVDQPILNYLSIDGQKVRWNGVAIFKEEKMVGILNRIESRSLLQINHNGTGEDLVTPCKVKPGLIAIQPNIVTSKVRFGNRKGRAVFRIMVNVKALVKEMTCSVNLDDPKSLQKVSRHVEKAYEIQAMNTVKKAQQLRSDIYGLGNFIRTYHPTWWKKLNWSTDFSKADISIKYKVVINPLGVRKTN
ncbi:spore germination protein KC [Marininema mesophilum]|uniref:Spore germination protein KC n=1 Tax=Marininema mesophilum TaxID=1048340 RepID=A0A1H2Q7E4_9BACL|nr:Ger(x)C family spore germination protein [Marininema mesophilum]SDW03051.1 spore germination protein KC [Marininema mesophilum]